MTISVGPVRYEHHREALGIGEPEPRLSWTVTTAPPGWRAARYELQQTDRTSATVDTADSVLVPWPFRR